jgi:RNA polymerase sigma-70 factor (ECF subfamily)
MRWSRSQATCAELTGAKPDTGADEWTAAALHERYLRDVFRYVARRVPGREEAEDVTAEVFAAAFVELPRFRGQCGPYPWLLGIARRKIADALRRRSVRREALVSELTDAAPGAGPLLQGITGGEEPAAAFERAEAVRVIRDLVDELKPDQRESLLLQYLEELSIAEIAVALGRSPAALNSLLQRARAALFRRGRAYFLDGDERNER